MVNLITERDNIEILCTLDYPANIDEFELILGNCPILFCKACQGITLLPIILFTKN